MGVQQFSMAAIQLSHRKADLPEMRNNDMKTRKVHVDRNKLNPGKNGDYMPSSLGSRSVGRQAGWQ